jgi:hypothetical protein
VCIGSLAVSPNRLDERLGALDIYPLDSRGAKPDIEAMKRYFVLAALSIGILGATAPAANAGLLVDTAPTCDGQVLSQPFKSYGDSNYYTPVPGGSFADSAPAGWQLNGARVQNGALTLPAGSSATSPTVCAGLEHPTMRFFAKSAGLLPLGSVSVLAETSLGLTVELPLGLISPGSSWHATPQYMVLANLLPLLPNNYTPLAFRFRAVTGTWSVDDVYLDPRKH